MNSSQYDRRTWIHMFVVGSLVGAPAIITPATGAEGKRSHIYKTIGERTLKVDVDYPPGWKASDRRPVMIFFSGGAFRTGNTRQFVPQAAYFAQRGLVCVRAEYRDRTKDKVEPDTCLKDAISAMRWLRKNAPMLGADPDKIISAGGSAGGFLAASACTTRDFHDPGDDLGISPRPSAMVLFNPVVDFVSLDRDIVKLAENKKLLEQISPLRNLTADLPPTLILIGSKDGFFDQVDQFVTPARNWARGWSGSWPRASRTPSSTNRPGWRRPPWRRMPSCNRSVTSSRSPRCRRLRRSKRIKLEDHFMDDLIPRLAGWLTFLANVIVCVSATQLYLRQNRRSILLIAVSAGLGAALGVVSWMAETPSPSFWRLIELGGILDVALWTVGVCSLFREISTAERSEGR
ncbi:MAG: alpha/beta hydrolase [Rhodobacteraceae bacterium]|nr:alpha/beta hydrolase [Paracoccaceae bacterium]